MSPEPPTPNPSAIIERLREILVGRHHVEASTQAAAQLEQRLNERLSQWHDALQQQLAAGEARLLADVRAELATLRAELAASRAANEEKLAALPDATEIFGRLAAAMRDLADRIDPPPPPQIPNPPQN